MATERDEREVVLFLKELLRQLEKDTCEKETDIAQREPVCVVTTPIGTECDVAHIFVPCCLSSSTSK